MNLNKTTMIFAGIDIGSATSKMVLLEDNNPSGYYVIPTGGNVKTAANKVMKQALSAHHLTANNLTYVVATGYGRNSVNPADKVCSEIICHARGAYHFHPSPCTVIDIGGQDSKVIEITDEGRVLDFMMNDKCAAGTGRFLELIANVMNMKLENLGNLSLQSQDPCSITSTCAVFAESEVISLRADGKKQKDIIAGIHRSIAYRIKLMTQNITVRPPVIFTGGVALNPGMVKALQIELGTGILTPEYPQMSGALGAALLARDAYLAEGTIAGEK
jgi:(R)-2-hydroxyacyl-CoA dehydratese activating ATPase